MADTEKGKEPQEATVPSAFHKIKKSATLKHVFIGLVLLISGLAVMFGMGIVSAKYAGLNRRVDDMAGVRQHIGHGHSDVLIRRQDVNGQDGIPVPISTQTALTTIYSISHKPVVVTETETETGTVFVTVQPKPGASTFTSLTTMESSAEICSVGVITMTRSVTVTMSSSYPPEDVTVTGNPSTVTEFRTDVSLSSGLPDATVSGNPDTVTDIQTNWSVSSDFPDATVSGNPSTVTDLQTDFSLSTGLPDATISGSPLTTTDIQTSYSASGSIWTVITITDLFPPHQTLSTVTKYATVQKTITAVVSSLVVVTVSENYPDPTAPLSGSQNAESEVDGEFMTPASPTSTFTKVVTETQGEPLTSTTTVQVMGPPPYPSANDTIAGGAVGTVTLIPNPSASAVIISGGSKKPEPRGWTGTTGSSNFGCVIMLVAVIMLSL